ncbi:hypothetical protein LZ31DRAFT_299515 [Colletotrichum somersetense]|nr:hypothetical protein LZ31DRAFT_299515 [Colletotrichum somersetense]
MTRACPTPAYQHAICEAKQNEKHEEKKTKKRLLLLLSLNVIMTSCSAHKMCCWMLGLAGTRMRCVYPAGPFPVALLLFTVIFCRMFSLFPCHVQESMGDTVYMGQ